MDSTPVTEVGLVSEYMKLHKDNWRELQYKNYAWIERKLASGITRFEFVKTRDPAGIMSWLDEQNSLEDNFENHWQYEIKGGNLIVEVRDPDSFRITFFKMVWN